MKITKGMTIKVLLISYIYTDKTVRAGSLGNRIKDYYEKNSRDTITITITPVSYTVPFTNDQCPQAVQYVKNKMPKGYDINVHLCNPKTSHTGAGNVITYASVTNVIHEFGHAIGLSHANSMLSGKSEGSRDPFDQMTITAPYPSTNAVHRYQLDWFLDHELVDYTTGQTKYTIGMLKNFSDKTSTKVVLYKVPATNDPTNIRKFFVSYGTKKEKKNDKFLTNYVALHTVYGKNSSFIIGMYKVANGKVYTNAESGLSITLGNEHNNTIDLVITTSSPAFRPVPVSVPKSDEDDSCDSCQLDMIEDSDEDEGDIFPRVF